MSSAITISGVVSSYEKKDGTRQIRLRITYKRKVRYLPTNLFAHPFQLNKQGEIKDAELKRRVLSLELQMYEKFRDTNLIDTINMDIDKAISIVTAPEKQPFHMNVIAHFDTFSAEKKRNTKQTYDFASNWLKRYLGRDELDITEIDLAFVDNMVAALEKQYGKRARSVSSIFASFAAVYRDIRKIARRSPGGEFIPNILEDYERPQMPKSEHRDISHELMQEIIDRRYEVWGRSQLRSLELFIMSFILSGMNLIDIYNCAAPKNDIIIFNRTKVADLRDDGAEVQVRIPGFAKRLCRKYADPTGNRAFRFYIDHPSYDSFYNTVNMSLHGALRRLGHDNEFTFYSARHTFATLCVANGTDKSIVNDCLGHVDPDMKMTNIYVRKDWNRHWSEVDKLLATFDWSSL